METGPFAGMMGDPETRFKLTLHYDGSAFHGWQIQPREPTVQGELESVVAQVTGTRRPVVAAGRTDTGVHASGQIAAVTMPSSWTADALSRSLNSMLPSSIWVEDVTVVGGDFHPRYQATSRSYEYRIGLMPGSRSPFWNRWCWPLCRPLDVEAMQRSSEALVGTRSFAAFSKSGQPERGHECRVHTASWRPWQDLGLAFEITANRFLHRMVRYLVGTLVDVGLGRRPGSDVHSLLSGDPAMTTSPPAPPGGLVLVQVGYESRSQQDGAETMAPAGPAGLRADWEKEDES